MKGLNILCQDDKINYVEDAIDALRVFDETLEFDSEWLYENPDEAILTITSDVHGEYKFKEEEIVQTLSDLVLKLYDERKAHLEDYSPEGEEVFLLFTADAWCSVSSYDFQGVFNDLKLALLYMMKKHETILIAETDSHYKPIEESKCYCDGPIDMIYIKNLDINEEI